LWYYNTEENIRRIMIMADSLKVMQTRRSCRAYKPQLIEDEKLEKIIKAGTFAATGRGKQSPIMIVVTNRELRDKLSKMNARIMGRDDGFDPFYGAPELIVVLADRSMPTYIYDGSLVMGNLMNAAEAVGVNSCWIHRAKEEFESEEGKKILNELGIVGDYEGIGHLVLGYAATPVNAPAPRKDNYVYYVK
jgi:nitroreductase